MTTVAHDALSKLPPTSDGLPMGPMMAPSLIMLPDR
jgi:hypothetical protein